MNFNDYEYKRPDIAKVKSDFSALLSDFDLAKSADSQINIINKINKLNNNISAMETIAEVRHSIDTSNKFYDDEQNFFNKVGPELKAFTSKYYSSLAKSKFKKELEDKFGKQLFRIAEFAVKSFDEKIIPELQQENELVDKYDKLIASAKIMFDGKEMNLPELGFYLGSKDRSIRKKANDAKYSFFREHESDFDDIYDKLVKVRTKMAQKLGYKNYVELGYLRMQRFDYNAKMVKNFRDQVLKSIVPMAVQLRERQRKRLKLDKLMYYDEKLNFLSGNASPKGDAQWILENGKKMYHELSPKTDEYFKYMTENNLLDLIAKKNKMSGGYCTFITNFNSPFIFSNFNGTDGDVNVLTHEAGHGLQMYCSRNFEVPEYHLPTMESAEIHSMSMEFLTWPYMELFFKEDADKYRFAHMADSFTFIPYGVTVDEFQHFVYEHPEASKDDRKKAWRDIEKKYIPDRDYGDNDFLEKGCYFYQQGHIFSVPFYYIDYTLAQLCSFQFWNKANVDREKALKDYFAVCMPGGSKSFLELLKIGHLLSPFDDGNVEKIIAPVKKYFEEIDDSIF